MSPTTRRSGSPRLAGGRNPLRRSPPRRIRLNSCRPPRDVRLSVRRSPERTTSRGPPPQPGCRHARTRCSRGNAYRGRPPEPGILCSEGHTRGPPKLASPVRHTRVAVSRTHRQTIPSGTVVSRSRVERHRRGGWRSRCFAAGGLRGPRRGGERAMRVPGLGLVPLRVGRAGHGRSSTCTQA